MTVKVQFLPEETVVLAALRHAVEVVSPPRGATVIRPGLPGAQGPAGPPGPGVAAGGTPGQALTKRTEADYDTQWTPISGEPTGPAGGDLGGTYPDPSVVDDSHAHTGATVSALDASDTKTGTFALARIPTGTTGTTVALGDAPGAAVTAHEAAADPHPGYQRESEKAAANGYPSLDANTKIPIAQLPTGATASTVSLGNHSHSGIPITIVDARGDLILGTGSDVVARQAVGSDGAVLTADSTQATGVKWAPAGGGSAPSGPAGGDLSGTYPNPSVVDDSHAHTGATISALDAGDVTSGTFAIAQIPTGTTAATVALGNRGLPSGGSAGQVLAKNTASSYDVGWVTPAGITRTVATVTVDTTLPAAANTDYVYLCGAAGAITITLPTAVGNKNLYTIKRVGAGTVNITTTSSQTIDGVSAFVLDVQYMAVGLVSNGANWAVV